MKHCLYCNKEITKWDNFRGFFWKTPLRINEFSQIWEDCCSYKCYGLQLTKLLRNMATESREVLDLSDFLCLSIDHFIDIPELIDYIDKTHYTEWAKAIIAAGYRRVAPNNNPLDRCFQYRDDTFGKYNIEEK